MIDPDEEGLHVPKRAVDVELALAGRPAVRVQVFVPVEHAGEATHAVLELVEHASAFLPARVPAERHVVIFNKETVVWIGVDAALVEEELYEFRHDVRLELVGGAELSGELLYSMPHEKARVVDYLNAPGRFVRLWTPKTLYLVNKAYLERVVEVPLDLDAAPSGGDPEA
jgi:hypothetical protein